MLNRQTLSIAAAVYGILVVVGFIVGSAKVGVLILILGAIVLGFLYRYSNAAGAANSGRERNRNRNRR